jgi:putative membrane protein insertion efficiency factor
VPCSNGATSGFDPGPSFAARLGLALIRAYKVLISPWFAGSCRFVPGCADYTAEAIARHGLVRGVWLGTCRLGRCHPLGGHGYDPVPPRRHHS